MGTKRRRDTGRKDTIGRVVRDSGKSVAGGVNASSRMALLASRVVDDEPEEVSMLRGVLEDQGLPSWCAPVIHRANSVPAGVVGSVVNDDLFRFGSGVPGGEDHSPSGFLSACVVAGEPAVVAEAVRLVPEGELPRDMMKVLSHDVDPGVAEALLSRGDVPGDIGFSMFRYGTPDVRRVTVSHAGSAAMVEYMADNGADPVDVVSNPVTGVETLGRFSSVPGCCRLVASHPNVSVGVLDSMMRSSDPVVRGAAVEFTGDEVAVRRGLRDESPEVRGVARRRLGLG